MIVSVLVDHDKEDIPTSSRVLSEKEQHGMCACVYVSVYVTLTGHFIWLTCSTACQRKYQISQSQGSNSMHLDVETPVG